MARLKRFWIVQKENITKNSNKAWGIVASEDDYESVVTLVVECWKMEKSFFFLFWKRKMENRCGLNSGRSYHMCSMKEYFETLELKEGRVIHLENDKAWKV